MDIRAFFQKKGGASGPAKPPAKKPAAVEKKPTAAAARPSRQAAKPKAEVVVLSDESEDEPPKKRAPARKKQVSDDDSDFDIQEVEPAPAAKKASPRKRVRRPVVDDDSEDDDVVMTSPAKKPTSKSPKKKASPSKSAVKREVKLNEAAIKAEEKLNAEDEDLSTPIAIKASGKPPPPVAGCLDGFTFVFSGVLANLKREEAVHLVKCCGGSVGTSVSRATKYLVVGDTLEQGGPVSEGSKYKEALAKNVRILKQNEFYNLVTERSAQKELDDLKKEKAALKTAANAPTTSNKGKQKLGSGASNDMLWVDKYKPTQLEDMIGNVELGKRIKQWLMDWDAVHVKGTKKVPFTNKLTENRGAKTVLLSGPPGIGKTTMATLVARECGFELLELNASDTRSKKMLQTGLKDVLGTQALHFGGGPSGSDNMRLSKRVVVMDEVDGMSGGDRGGTAELIQLIKKSKTPIICICNDRQSQKVRSLANHSFDLRMRRPTKIQIGRRLMEIGLKEGLSIEKNAIEEAADRCGNDIRQLLTQMQKWRLTTTKVTYADLVDPSSQHNKDEVLRLNPFSATQQIFQRDTSFDARNEAYFVDYDLMPLMVQENYIQSIMNNKNTSDEKLECAMNAAAYISESDLVNTYVRAEQRWDLLTKQAALNVAACVYSAGFIGHPEFSKWLGKNSSASKSKRLLSELSVRMRAHASGSREVIRLDYVPYMKEILLQKLLAGDDHIEEVIELLDECEISREDLTESMESFKFPGVKRHAYADLDTKAKTTFTRVYNKASHKSQGVVESALGSTTIKKSRGKAAATTGDGEEGGLAPPSDAESEPDEEADTDMSKFQKKARGGGRATGGTAGTKRKAPATAAKPKAKAAPKKRKS